MKVYYRVLFFVLVSVLIIGCSSHISFEKLIGNIPTNIENRTYSSKKMGYSILMPKRFEIKEKQYDNTMLFELFIDTLESLDEASMFSVLKYSSIDTGMPLKEEWHKLMSKRPLIENFRIYSEGLTNFLSKPAYYEHSACTISKKNTESISFLFRGDSSSLFGISIQIVTEKDYPNNMEELLYCAKSIKILNKTK